MELTDYEKEMIAGRAYGSYASIPKLKVLLSKHNRKNRHAGDLIYLEFLRCALSKRDVEWDEYTRLARRVTAMHPIRQIISESDPVVREKVIRCRTCNEPGHTARRCPERPAEAVSIDNGVPRLTAGWDPSKES